jgi:hypothetical protein
MSGCTTPQTACEIHYAIGSAPQANGDKVVILPGTYDAGDMPIVASQAISIHGEVGQPMPQIDGSTNDPANDALLVLDGGHGTRVSDLKLVQSGSNHQPYGVDDSAGGARLDRLFVEMTSSSQGAGVLLNNGTVLSDSVVWAEGQGEAIGQLSAGSSRVENVTASAGNSVGISASNNLPSGSMSISVENSIVHGGTVDLQTLSTGGGNASISVGYSNYASTSGTIDATEGHNQLAAPVLVNPAAGDFQEQPSSPTVDAGIASRFIGPEDLAGHPRVLGRAPDIGAYELVVPKVITGRAHTAGRTATVQGTVNPEGLAVSSCTFQYRPSTAYGSKAPCARAPGAGSGPVVVSAQLRGLAPGVTYHYRLIAGDVHGTGAGADRVFTVARPPELLTAPHVTGRGVVGRILSCSPGTWTDHPKLAYGWLRDGGQVRGARASTYRVSNRDVGHALQCRVTASDNVGTSTAVSNSVVARGRRR